jgi:phosphatidylglycerol:prolipoprotein diacylglycerol transferase
MHPILLHLPGWLGGRPLYSYGVMLGLSFLAGWLLTSWLARRDGIENRVVRRVLIAAMAGAIVGARILFLIAYPEAWQGPASLIRLQEGGLVAQGGMLGGIVAAVIVCRWHALSFWRFADHAAPSLALGLGLTRIGCFLNGCCFGRVTDSFLGVRFPAGSPAFARHLQAGLLDAGAAHSAPVLPVQLLASLNGFLCLALLLVLLKRCTAHGQVFVSFVLWYSPTRFLLEMLRDDPQRGFVGPLSTSQIVSALAFAAGLVAWWWLSRRDHAVR